MVDIEKKNIDIAAWWWAKEKTDYTKILWWADKEKFWAKETEEEHRQADELIKNMPWKEKIGITMPTKKNADFGIHETVHKLNRPEAEEWLTQSYTTIDKTIKGSKNDKWIAWVIGKIMNRINP